jgi:hypothetical protein
MINGKGMQKPDGSEVFTFDSLLEASKVISGKKIRKNAGVLL